MLRRFAAVLGLVGIVACGGAEKDRDPADRLVERLQAEPGLAPPELDPGTEVVLVEVGMEGATVVLPRPSFPQPGATLRLERALARRATRVPVLWAVVTDPDGEDVRYWSATTDQAEIRSTVRDPGEDRHRGGRSTAKGAATSIRVPFVPQGRLRFYRASGGVLASYRFGDRPEAVVDPEERCPQVYRVHGPGSSESTLDILVLPDGFTEPELPLYRCSVALLFERLFGMDPFDRVSGSINVYRIDQVSSASGIEVPATCPRDGMHHYGPLKDPERLDSLREECRRLEADLVGDPVLPEGGFCTACRETDLDFFHDPAVSADCRVLWTDAEGLRRIWELTPCAPKVDIVVVVANSVAHSGAGTGDGHPPVSVTTLSDVDDGDRRAELLGHELGHALGLLDEYALATGEVPVFHSGRNVVRRKQDGSIEDPPWAKHCVGLDGKAAASCVVATGATCSNDVPPTQEIPNVGLIEGAFYRSCDYFRAENTCLLDQESDYCIGCRVYLGSLFDELLAPPSTNRR